MPESWPKKSEFFGLAVKVVGTAPQQLHIGAFFWSDDELYLGDLQWHLRLGREKARSADGFYWLPLNIDVNEQRLLAAQLEAWLRLNNGRIPYAAASAGPVHFRDDVWVSSPPGVGLTCATFIVELFRELQIPFIDLSSWRQRAGDAEWAARILQLLSVHSSASRAHVEAQYGAIGHMRRVRPSDLVAAGLLQSPNAMKGVEFKDVHSFSTKFEEALLACAAERE